MNGDPISRFLAHATQRPEHPAVVLGDRVVTYAELALAARRFATRFAQVSGPKILIALPPGPDAYAAMLGALLGGGCYIPVNVAVPAGKLARLVDMIRPDIIVAGAALREIMAQACVSRGEAPPILVDPAQLGDTPPLRGSGQRHATAYVILTSGSTGTPKGVVIAMTALSHYTQWLHEARVFHAGDRVAQFSNISFDLSVLEIYGALNAGATLLPPATEADRLFPAGFAQRCAMSVWISVPSAIALVMKARQANAALLGAIRLFVFCGEALRPAHLSAIFQANPRACVMNLYGPTEATVSMTALRVDADTYASACADAMALGDPIPGMGLHLLGGAHADEGEIVLTGPQLATEYWNDPERTRQAFRSVPIGGETMRGYFTGDRGERRNGHVFFRGRIDHQVKINGYRIETGEIVARLGDCGWPVACVLKHRDLLIAVVEAVPDRCFDPGALRARLFGELEPHAVPAYVHLIERMPRNGNGKLDEASVRAWLDVCLTQACGSAHRSALQPDPAGARRLQTPMNGFQGLALGEVRGQRPWPGLAFLIIGADSLIGGAVAAAHAPVLGTTRREGVAGRIQLDLATLPPDWQPPAETRAACIAAGITRLADCEADPAGSARINVTSTVELAKRLAERGVYTLFLSTSQVFDGTTPDVAASAQRTPVSVYGRQKATTEAALERMMAAGAPLGILRLGKIVSPGMALFADWQARLLAGRRVTAFEDMVFAPVPLALAVQAILAMLRTRHCGITQLCGPRDISYRDAARHLAAQLGADPLLVTSDRAAARRLPAGANPAHTTLDSRLLHATYGIAVPDGLDVIAAQVVDSAAA